MSEPIAIRVEKLGKRYRLREKSEPYLTLRDALTHAVQAPYRILAQSLLRRNTLVELGATADEHWSLHDVSFEVYRGETLAIVGHNGSGKSTLLKILAGITAPSAGHADVYGRVGALLEVGTGFHSELSGRENVYLNGAILGMRRMEIEARFDDIVRFSEVQRYIDQPVKYYSSGMFLRLGFSVAAHFEAPILLIDEVLSVGDLAFQNRCLSKIRELTESGRTVIFVSHDLEAVNRIADRAILLAQGKVIASGTPERITRYYVEMTANQGGEAEI